MLEQAAEFGPATDPADRLMPPHFPNRIRQLIEPAVPNTLMRPLLVVVIHERLHDVVDVPQAEAGEVVQAFPPNCCDPRLSERIGIGCHHGRFDNLNAGRAQQPIKRSREFCVPVMDQVRRFQAHFLEPHQQVPSLLEHPFLVGVIRGR